MKITRLTAFRVPPRWMFLKIETDVGLRVLDDEARARAASVGAPDGRNPVRRRADTSVAGW